MSSFLYSLSMTANNNTSPSNYTAPLTEARSRLSEIVDEVESTGAEFVITKHGRPAAVIVGHEEYESLIETLNILADSDTVAAIAEAEADLAAGDLVPLD